MNKHWKEVVKTQTGSLKKLIKLENPSKKNRKQKSILK
jgi:hypothetical protein